MRGCCTAVLAFALLAAPLAATAQRPVPPTGPGPGAGRQPATPARGGPPRDAPRGTSILRGIVVAADSGTPIRRAQVRVTGQAVGTRLATTDAQGRFEIRELVAGRYTLGAAKGGFVSLQYGQRRPSEAGTPLELGESQVMDKLVIGLPRGSVISGRITDEFGEPVANASVSAMRYGYAAGTRRLLPGAGQNSRDTTDDQGAFRLFGLSPGEYVVSAAFRGSGAVEVTDPAGENTGYAPTFYPGTPNVAEAQRIAVALGQEQGNVVFSLIATRLVRVTGAVLNSQGTPVSNGTVMLAPASARLGAGAIAQGMTGRIDGSGQFRVANVPPGRYTAQVRSMRGRAGADSLAEFGRQEITVGGDDLDGVVIVTAPGARVTGQIVTDNGVPATIRPQQVSVGARLAQPEQTSPAGQSSRVNDNWTFEISGLFDARLFRTGLPQGWNLKAVLLNGQDITDTPIEMPPGQTVTGLEVVITEKSSTVSGRVTDARGAAVTDVTVVIFPADEARWTYQSRFTRAARPDQDGHFHISGLPPLDRYLAVAVQALEDGQAGDPEFLASVKSASTSFSLGEGEVRALDLRFAR